jgi:hypothetical protein
MPLIRYRTGDLGRLDASPCPCGSVLRRLLVFGRLDDLMTAADGRTLSLTDLAEAVYGLKFATSFSASLSASPAPLLTLTLGTAERTSPGWIPEAERALSPVLGPGTGLLIRLAPGAPPPAPGGAKPALIREGL